MGRNIEDLDKEIIGLVAERSRLYGEELRKRGGQTADRHSLQDRIRICEVIESLPGVPAIGDILKKFYNEMISASLAAVQPLPVAYLGPPGTFTHIALLEIFGGSVEPIPQKTIPDVFHEVEMGRVAFGVVPIENSTEGAVTYTLDELLETDLRIVSEKFLRVSYCLLSLRGDLKEIRNLYSHPQTFGQCKTWIRKNLPAAEIHQVNSTSQAAETAAREKYSAALASEASAKLFDLNILARDIEDSRQNYTRFLVIGKKDNTPSGRDKTSIVCAVKDKPGALYGLLKPFSENGINMTKIESRPDKKKMWEYNFFIDFVGHRDDTIVKNVLERMKEETIFLKILGSYPEAN